jgi:VanZ family protein
MLFSFGFSPPGTGSFPLADKVGHALMYFATFFCFLLAAVWRPGRGDGTFPRKGLVFALGVVAAGVGIEVLQDLATVTRHAELGDVISEVIGAFSALAILTWMRRAWGSAAG